MSSIIQEEKEQTLTMATGVRRATLNLGLTHPKQGTASHLNGLRARSAGWLTISWFTDASCGIRRPFRTFQWRSMLTVGHLVLPNLPGESTTDCCRQSQ